MQVEGNRYAFSANKLLSTFFNQLSPEIMESFTGLQRTLESRFREKLTKASYLNELERRKFSFKDFF